MRNFIYTAKEEIILFKSDFYLQNEIQISNSIYQCINSDVRTK